MDAAEMEQRLWEYIDGLCSDEEAAGMERLIREDGAWHAQYDALLQMHRSLSAMELEAPSLRFTKNVMEALTTQQIAPAVKSYINKKIIRGIAAFFILTILGFLIYGFGQMDRWVAGGNTIAGMDFRKIEYDALFNGTVANVALMLNAVLGLLLLDAWLRRKKNATPKTTAPGSM